MRHRPVLFLFPVLLSCSSQLWSQEVKTVLPADTLSTDVVKGMAVATTASSDLSPEAYSFHQHQPTDTFYSIPTWRNGYAAPLIWSGYGRVAEGWDDWRLHSGLNVSLSASATVGFGRHALSGFSENVSIMYATALTPQLSLALGGYYSHFNLGHSDFSDAGVNAVLNYCFNERWEASIYAQKSLLTPQVPRPVYDLSNLGDKIGAELRYNISPTATIGVSVWYQNMPHVPGPPPDRTNQTFR